MSVSPENFGRIIAPYRKPEKADALGPVCEINEQCLQLLVEAARSSNVPRNGFVGELIATLSGLDAPTQVCASRFPFLLVDIRFRDCTWWREVATHPTRIWSDPTWLARFPRSSAVKLARATLVLVWHTVRMDLEAAFVLLGLAPSVAEVIVELRLRDIDRIAERQFRHVRPRWEDRPAVWHQLLACARTGNWTPPMSSSCTHFSSPREQCCRGAIPSKAHIAGRRGKKADPDSEAVA